MSRILCPDILPDSFECISAVRVYINPSVKSSIPMKKSMLGFRVKSLAVNIATLAATEYFVTRYFIIMLWENLYIRKKSPVIPKNQENIK